MTRNILLGTVLTTLALFSVSALADFGSTDTTTVQADWRCEQAGGGIAIQMPTAKKPARAWQTDVGQSDGLELTMKSFKVTDCPENFEFTADLFGSEVRGVVTNRILDYSMYDADHKSWTPLLQHVQCKAVGVP